jgi:hypothetical protein
MAHEFEPGWMARQMEDIRREVASWPAWKREALGLAGPAPVTVEGEANACSIEPGTRTVLLQTHDEDTCAPCHLTAAQAESLAGHLLAMARAIRAAGDTSR